MNLNEVRYTEAESEKVMVNVPKKWKSSLSV